MGKESQKEYKKILFEIFTWLANTKSNLPPDKLKLTSHFLLCVHLQLVTQDFMNSMTSGMLFREINQFLKAQLFTLRKYKK